MKIKVLSACLFAVSPLVDGGDATFKADKCSTLKKIYKDNSCCGNGDTSSNFQVVPMPEPTGGVFAAIANPCKDAKKKTQPTFNNKPCRTGTGTLTKESTVNTAIAEQSATDVTVGYKGTKATDAVPIEDHYFQKGLCPVNVHWHLGAEHRSDKEYDEDGTGPAIPVLAAPHKTVVATPVLHGRRCHKYINTDAKFTKEYNWQHCTNMTVGETYEVHWPHSTQGACGTIHQYQSPFYDGVFCSMNTGAVDKPKELGTDYPGHIGVHGQVFVVVNDEKYYYPDLISGMVRGGDYGKPENIAYYTGSTTGTSRNNIDQCSYYAPITWQVDRKCHLISASSFDKMCADMKAQHADMSSDLHPHGSRELVSDDLAANNHKSRPRRLNDEGLHEDRMELPVPL